MPYSKSSKPSSRPVDGSTRGSELSDDIQHDEAAAVEKVTRATSKQSGAVRRLPRGDFSQRSFAELLAEIYRWRATGALLARRDQVKKIVYFREGTPQLVKSNVPAECLGRILVGEKIISVAECEESLRRMKATGRMQGTTLIQMGCMSPHNLQYGLHLQLCEKLYDIFRWTSGQFEFDPSADSPPEPITFEMTCAQLIAEGVRRAYDEKRIQSALGNVDGLYVHPASEPLYALQEAGLGDEEKTLLLQADGRRSVATLRAESTLPHLEVDRLLFAMKSAQMIVLRTEPKGRNSPPTFADIVGARPSVGPPPIPRRTAPLPEGKARGGSLTRRHLPPPVPPSSAPPRKQPAVSVPAPKPPPLLPEISGYSNVSEIVEVSSRQREQLASTLSQLSAQDYFEMLGVGRKADREEIKSAFFGLAKQYHPDRHFQSASTEVRNLARQIYELLSLAHDTLVDQSSRADYIRTMRKGRPNPPPAEVNKVLAAEGKFKRGEDLFRQEKFGLAVQAFRDAISLCPQESEFHAWLGWSLFQSDRSKHGDALRAIEKAVELNPKLDLSYLFGGYIHQACGRPDKAEKQFELAVRCNPNCTEALLQLRILGQSR